MKLFVRLAMFLALAVPGPCAAQELRVFSSGGAAVAQQSLAAKMGGASRIVFTVAMPAVLQAKLEAG